MPRTFLVNARIATMRGGKYAIVEKGAMIARDGIIEWIGPMKELDAHRSTPPRALTGGGSEAAMRASDVVDAMGIREATGTVLDHLYVIDSATAKKRLGLPLDL